MWFTGTGSGSLLATVQLILLAAQQAGMAPG
jgi:hypothetical protein